jgi:hypothetical protein
MTLFAITKNELESIERRSYKLLLAIEEIAKYEVCNRHTNEVELIKIWKKLCRAKTIWIKFYDLKKSFEQN